MEQKIGFARRLRPDNLDGYIGNTDVKETVRLYLKNSRPQSILLTGDSGCGKTTLARILGREYCCEHRDPIKGACGECISCLAFNEYIKTGVTDYLSDIYEIDASEDSSKKEMDSILSSMEYPAMSGYWKVYIIDEAHLLSEGAMGRLLKTLEEPPEGVLLILCTTNPEKLLDTIRNRCILKLAITKPKTTEIMDLLQRVCLQEDKNYDLAGLRMIVTRSNNVIRDSLNNLETVLNTRGDATAENVSKQFKQVSDKIIFDFYEAYLNSDYVGYINVMYKIKTEFGFSNFIANLTTFTTRGIYIINSVEVEGLSKEELDSYLNLFKKFPPEDISMILSQLKRINIGDIEANLMAFIYCKELERPTEKSISPTISQESMGLQEERIFRNDNLKKIQEVKLQNGLSSITSELEMVSLSEDIQDFFTLEKVDIE